MAECTHLARTSAYFDGALPVADEPAAVDHLAECAECQAVLRDAATFDAVISQAPPAAGHVTPGAALPLRRPARRRWAIVATVGMAAAAAIAIWLAVPHGEPHGGGQVASELPRARALEARFTGSRLGAYRPYDPLRGDVAHEAISLATLAELERHGDTADLIAALAATGDLARATQLADRRAIDDPAAEADRAALALAAGTPDAALAHAYRALELSPMLAAAAWNLALAARTAHLPRVSRAAFAQVAALAEPGWSDEANRQLAALDAQLATDHPDPAALRTRADAERTAGHPALARAVFDEAARAAAAH